MAVVRGRAAVMTGCGPPPGSSPTQSPVHGRKTGSRSWTGRGCARRCRAVSSPGRAVTTSHARPSTRATRPGSRPSAAISWKAASTDSRQPKGSSGCSESGNVVDDNGDALRGRMVSRAGAVTGQPRGGRGIDGCATRWAARTKLTSIRPTSPLSRAGRLFPGRDAVMGTGIVEQPTGPHNGISAPSCGRRVTTDHWSSDGRRTNQPAGVSPPAFRARGRPVTASR